MSRKIPVQATINGEEVEFLCEPRQSLLEVLRESLAFAKHTHQENLLRWRNILNRWDKDFPDLPADGKRAYPVLEKAYLNLVQNMMTDLIELEEDGFDSDFALQDFLDRHGMRVGQLGHLLSIVGPISEIGNQAENKGGGAQPG